MREMEKEEEIGRKVKIYRELLRERERKKGRKIKKIH